MGVAGRLKIRSTTIDVYPKFLRGSDAIAQWDALLLPLLSVALPRFRFVATVRQPAKSTRRTSFVDHLAFAYAAALDRGLRSGPLLAYQSVEGPISELRGQFVVESQLNHLLSPPGAIECRFGQLEPDNVFSRLLAWAALRLAAGSRTPSTRARLFALMPRLNAVPVAPAEVDAGRLELMPQHEAYRDAFELAQWLVMGGSVGFVGGVRAGASIVVNMERLFERFVNGLMRRPTASARHGGIDWHSRPQQPSLLARELDGDREVWTIPDDRLIVGGATKIVVDAKYKLSLESNQIGQNSFGDDVYQLAGAARAAGCHLALLVYPRLEGSGPGLDFRVWQLPKFGSQPEVWMAAKGVAMSGLAAPGGVQRTVDDLESALRGVSGLERSLRGS
jgi:5-methylcytosine-specific restriction endonuclease McrBC regulatory subunit McrC